MDTPCNETTKGIANEPDFRKCGMKEETEHHVMCECLAIKVHQSVMLYWKPLLLTEEIMEEPLWNIARFYSRLGYKTRKPVVVQWARP